MGLPKFEWDKIPLSHSVEDVVSALGADVPVSASPLLATCVNVGNPHVVFIVDDIDTCGVEKVGPVVENHRLFPQRVNVNFVHVAGDKLRLRTWERSAGITGFLFTEGV